MKLKKDKISNILFSILLSLSIILGVNNFCYAEGDDNVTANFKFEVTNSGLEATDTVTVIPYVKFVPGKNYLNSTVNIESFNFTLNYSGSDEEHPISYKSFKEGTIFTGCGSLTDYDGSLEFGWFDFINKTGIDVDVNTFIPLGTLTFSFGNQMEVGNQIHFAVDATTDKTGLFYTYFRDISGTPAVLPDPNAEGTDELLALHYTLQSCTHPEIESADWETVTPPTCTEKGTKTWTCPECGEKINVDIDPLGHSFKWTAIDGNQHQEICERDGCDAKNGDPEDHTWDSYEPINDTQHKKTCSKCGHSVDEPHNFPSEWTPDNNATCTKNGTKHKECPNCHKTIYADNDEDPATGHTWDEGVVTQEPTYLADGVRTYTCQNCGETRTETIPKLTHDDPTAGVQYWGTREEHNGHEMYVDEEGRTSALVTGNERIWLREESYDPAARQNLAAWYMLDNTSGEFEAGSRFWVKWLNNIDNPEEFAKYSALVDQKIRDRVESGRMWIFLVGVTKPDGTTEYTVLSAEIPLYIQIGTDWDYNDIKAMYISDSEDEEVYVSYLNMVCPEGKFEFAKLGMKHFSPYAIYDYLTDEEKAEFDKLTDEQKEELDATAKELISQQQEQSATSEEAKPETSSSSSAVKTGDETGYVVLMSSSMALIAGLYLELCMKKKRN